MKRSKNPFKAKIERLRDGGMPRVIDLFAGCGGITLGFHAAGFEVVGAVELDKAAARTHALNFHSHGSEEWMEIHARPRDITATDAKSLMEEFGIKKTEGAVDVVVGGPPCQAFARVGRAKLREVAQHPKAFLKDPRSNLYLRYLDFIRELKPLALMMENVPDVLNFGGHNIAEEICEVLEDLGYEPRYTLLNAVFYGVPQMRERMVLVAYHSSLSANRWFPEPTHWIDLPAGYMGTRQVATKTIRDDLFQEECYFVQPPDLAAGRDLQPAVTAEDALSDLPPIGDDSPMKKSKGPRRFDRLAKYVRDPGNDYQRLMREWRGFESIDGVYDHVIRYLPRDYKIFARMKPGDQYPEAHALALEMFEERLRQIERSEGRRPRRGSARYEMEKANYVPPYDPTKFPNKWRKMEADLPARTLMAHLGKDSYSHIHYDDAQARTISVREAARLQSFPDGFTFVGPMNTAFKQIGNAVPPLMAKAVAMVISEELRGERRDEQENCIEAAVGI